MKERERESKQKADSQRSHKAASGLVFTHTHTCVGGLQPHTGPLSETIAARYAANGFDRLQNTHTTPMCSFVWFSVMLPVEGRRLRDVNLLRFVPK